jgi:hypothetical protein
MDSHGETSDGSPLLQLCDELLLHIFTFLDIPELLHASRVSELSVCLSSVVPSGSTIPFHPILRPRPSAIPPRSRSPVPRPLLADQRINHHDTTDMPSSSPHSHRPNPAPPASTQHPADPLNPSDSASGTGFPPSAAYLLSPARFCGPLPRPELQLNYARP